jgi:hypothetical protein
MTDELRLVMVVDEAQRGLPGILELCAMELRNHASILVLRSSARKVMPRMFGEWGHLYFRDS